MIEGLVMPYRAKAGELLERWREAERQFDVAGEAEQRIELHTEMARLRAEYQEVFKAAHAAKMPEPPPFLSNMREPGKPTKTFSVGEWLDGQLECPADELSSSTRRQRSSRTASRRGCSLGPAPTPTAPSSSRGLDWASAG
jgi:aminoglycoside phosphotransferase (APT) family kinase protein